MNNKNSTNDTNEGVSSSEDLKLFRVWVSRTLVNKVKALAAYHDKSLKDYTAEILSGVVELESMKDFQELRNSAKKRGLSTVEMIKLVIKDYNTRLKSGGD